MDNRHTGVSNIVFRATNNIRKWIIKHIKIQIWLCPPNWKEQRGWPQIPVWPLFSFLVLLFLSPCDVAIQVFKPHHNSAQISIYGVSCPHKRKHFLTDQHWPYHRTPCPGSLYLSGTFSSSSSLSGTKRGRLLRRRNNADDIADCALFQYFSCTVRSESDPITMRWVMACIACAVPI